MYFVGFAFWLETIDKWAYLKTDLIKRGEKSVSCVECTQKHLLINSLERKGLLISTNIVHCNLTSHSQIPHMGRHM